jgi:hypothetical protein
VESEIDEVIKARLLWYRLVLDQAEHRGFTDAVRIMSLPDLVECLRAAIEVEAWRYTLTEYEYKDGKVVRKL